MNVMLVVCSTVACASLRIPSFLHWAANPIRRLTHSFAGCSSALYGDDSVFITEAKCMVSLATLAPKVRSQPPRGLIR